MGVALHFLSLLIFVAYPAVVAYLVWIMARSAWGRTSYVPWVRKLSAGMELVVRIALCSIAALFAVVFTLFSWSAGGAALVRLMPTLGSVAYALGCLLWRGRGAFWLRVVGWTAMTAGVAIPSQATLFLPIVGVLSIALHKIPTVAQDPSAGSPSPAPGS